MQSNGARAGLGVILVAAVVILFFVFKGGDDNSGGDTVTTTTKVTTEPNGQTTTETVTEVPTVVVKNAKPVGGVQDLTFNKGGTIKFKVQSDTADEVHFHGYDIGKDVEAGGTVTFDVPATIDGIFEVELEDHKEQIAEVRVNP
jgi:hypothetical protein